MVVWCDDVGVGVWTIKLSESRKKCAIPIRLSVYWAWGDKVDKKFAIPNLWQYFWIIFRKYGKNFGIALILRSEHCGCIKIGKHYFTTYFFIFLSPKMDWCMTTSRFLPHLLAPIKKSALYFFPNLTKSINVLRPYPHACRR